MTIVDSWLHFLCKNINVEENGKYHHRIVDPRQDQRKLSFADWSWIRAGFFLKWSNFRERAPSVTLICFGESKRLRKRLEGIKWNELGAQALKDPYSLFVIILDELFLQMDGLGWGLNSVLGEMERVSVILTWTTTSGS